MESIKQLIRKCADDFYPKSGNTFQVPPPKGWGRAGLLVLISLVVLVDLPFIMRHYMVGHDTKQILGIFDYIYSGWVYSGELPRWMAYGLQGLDAAPFYLAFMSASDFFAVFAGKFLQVTDSMSLFTASICVEQLLFLLGMYLLSVRLYRERITVFCVCLTAALMIEWQFQLFFNLRLFCLLPLEFFLILRFAESRAGWLGWLVGVVAIIGPTGSTYAYMFWALILTAFSLAVFRGRFGVLKSMLKPAVPNVLTAIIFILVAMFFCGSLYHAMDNFTYTSPGRETSGNVSIFTFLTYGGSSLPDLFASLYSPSKFMANNGGHAGMADYIGLVGIFCLPWTLLNLRRYEVAWPFVTVGALILMLSLGGILACVIYCFPGMHLFRHIGFLGGAIKVIILVLAGFGMDRLVNMIRSGTLIPRPNFMTLFLICVALVVFVDLNVDGHILIDAIRAAQKGPMDLFNQLERGAIYPIARAGLLFILILNAWPAGRPTAGQSTQSKINFTLVMLVMCVLADGLLFQSELYTQQNKVEQKMVFPAVKLNWPQDYTSLTNLDQSGHIHDITEILDVLPLKKLPDGILQKYSAWTNSLGAEYQAAVSGVLQWDPATPAFRTDWLPKNIVAMRAAVGISNQLSLLSLPGLGKAKFRVMPDSSVKYVKTDQAAMDLLKTHLDWSRIVIITSETNHSTDNPPPLAATTADCRVKKLDFQPNSYSLSVFNGTSQPVWLIDSAAYSSDWTVTVNQQPVPLLKAYGACRAVQLKPGSSLVHFQYRHNTRSVCLAGFAITAGSLTASCLLVLIWLVKRELFGQ